jgi:hypothetical protein
MTSPPDSFAAAFDAIEIDPARAPSSAAIDAALAMFAPPDEPGFYLLDDAGGRFVVDREWGLVSLKDAATLAAELGAEHAVLLKVVEPSGDIYELALRLRLSGLVPQVVGNEFPLGDDHAEDAGALDIVLPAVAWGAFAGFAGARTGAFICNEEAPFGIVAAPSCPSGVTGACVLELGAAPPRAAPAHAAWAI